MNACQKGNPLQRLSCKGNKTQIVEDLSVRNNLLKKIKHKTSVAGICRYGYLYVNLDLHTRLLTTPTTKPPILVGLDGC